VNRIFSNTFAPAMAGEPPQFEIGSNYTTYKFLYSPFAGVNDEVSYFYVQKFGDDKYSLSQVKSMGKIVLPMYQKMIESGQYPPFEFFEARHAPTPTQSILMSKEIGELSGLDYLFVWAYLSCLESLAKSGIIDMKHYNPGLKELTTTTEIHPVNNIIDAIKNTPEKISESIKSISAPVDTASKRILIFAGIAVGGYALFSLNKYYPKKKN